MNDQLPMFNPEISPGTPSAISSRGSASGVTRSGSRDGQTTAKSGPAPAPVSPSARQAKAKRSTTKGIFGQSSFASSQHDDLSFALASKYRALTDSLGSTLFTLTWTTRITPAGHSICALRASEPRTEDSVCIGWPTPQSHDVTTRGNTEADGHYFPHDPSNAALMASWPTPQSSDMTGGGQAKRSEGRANLNDFAMLAGWPTATVEDYKDDGLKVMARMDAGDFRCETEESCTQERMAEHAPDLNKQVMLAGWKTPCVPNGGRISGHATDIGKHQDGTKAQIGLENEAKLSGWATPKVKSGDYQYGNADHSQINLNLSGQARLTAFGDQPIGYLLGLNGWEIVPASGQLNAAHSRWLMGLPPEWDVCGVTAMGSSRQSRRGL